MNVWAAMGEIIVYSCRSMNITQPCLGVICDEHAFVSPKTPVIACLWGMPVMLTAGSRVHVIVMDYAGHARGGMPFMLAGHVSHARGGMPVTNYASHARLHASMMLAAGGHASHVGA